MFNKKFLLIALAMTNSSLVFGDQTKLSTHLKNLEKIENLVEAEDAALEKVQQTIQKDEVDAYEHAAQEEKKRSFRQRFSDMTHSLSSTVLSAKDKMIALGSDAKDKIVSMGRVAKDKVVSMGRSAKDMIVHKWHALMHTLLGAKTEKVLNKNVKPTEHAELATNQKILRILKVLDLMDLDRKRASNEEEEAKILQGRFECFEEGVKKLSQEEQTEGNLLIVGMNCLNSSLNQANKPSKISFDFEDSDDEDEDSNDRPEMKKAARKAKERMKKRALS